jgi:hypothetical protein
MERIRIRDPGWKKFGSGINIPDPQHCRKAKKNSGERISKKEAHLIAGFLLSVDGQVRGARLEYLLLGVEQWVGVAGESRHQDGVPGAAPNGRAQDLHPLRARGAHHHGLQVLKNDEGVFYIDHIRKINIIQF